MNKTRRKELENAMVLIRQAMEIVETVRDDEQEAYDSLPAGIQDSDRGEQMDENINDMDSVVEELDSQIDILEDIICR